MIIPRSNTKGELDKYVGKDLKASLEKQINSDIKTFGIIQVLRKGVELNNIKVLLFYPKPSAADYTPDLKVLNHF